MTATVTATREHGGNLTSTVVRTRMARVALLTAIHPHRFPTVAEAVAPVFARAAVRGGSDSTGEADCEGRSRSSPHCLLAGRKRSISFYGPCHASNAWIR